MQYTLSQRLAIIRYQRKLYKRRIGQFWHANRKLFGLASGVSALAAVSVFALSSRMTETRAVSTATVIPSLATASTEQGPSAGKTEVQVNVPVPNDTPAVELERLRTRNRRLEALVQVLRQRSSHAAMLSSGANHAGTSR